MMPDVAPKTWHLVKLAVVVIKGTNGIFEVLQITLSF
jgi:hypothetical protein